MNEDESIEIETEDGEVIKIEIDRIKDEEIKAIKDQVTPKFGIDYFTPEQVSEIAINATPILGVDYLTPSEVDNIKKSIKPIAGIDYEIPPAEVVDINKIVKEVSKKIPKVKDIDKTAIVSEVLSKIPKLEPFKLELTQEDLLNRINKYDKDIDWKVLKNIPYDVLHGGKSSGKIGRGGATRFTQLVDAPSSYSGQAGKFPKVKATEDGLEFATVSVSTPSLQQVTDVGATTTNDIIVPDEAYGAGWNGSLEVPTKNALYDKIETLGSGASIGGTITNGTAGSVLFVNPNSTLAQDNEDFYYEPTEKRLSLFTTLGTELLTNGTFTGGSSPWTLNSGWAYSSNSVSHTSNGTGTLTQNVAIPAFREHLLVYTISGLTVGSVNVTLNMGTGSYSGASRTANGTYSERINLSFPATSVNFVPSNTARLTVDSVSLKPLIGTNTKVNLSVGGVSVEGSWSNGSPNTTRAFTFSNDGSYTWTDYRFNGTLRVAQGANNSGGMDFYTSGGNYVAFYSGSAGFGSTTLYSYNYPTAFVHYSEGRFGTKVLAGSLGTPTSTLQSAGGLGLKVKKIFASQTLDNTATHWLSDASTASACTGTPSVTACSTYSGSGQSVCESHLPCTYFAGSSCSSFDYESGMSTCSSTSGCTVVTSSCTGGDETTCLANDDAYGGSCAWTLGSNTCPSFSDYTTCDANSPCYSDNSGDCNTLSDGGGDGTACATQPQCSYDSMSGTCSGSYFTSCAGDNSAYSCTGSYNTGTCSGSYGVSCNGTVSCSSYTSSGPCTAESGCSYTTALTLSLPSILTYPDMTAWILNDASGGADTIIVPSSGETINGASSFTLSNYRDGIHIAPYNDSRDCSSFNEGACTPSGCTKNYTSCSWNSGDNTCSGNAVCVGVGDQASCEATTYFTSCSGSYVVSTDWRIWSRT